MPEHFDKVKAFIKPEGQVIDIGCGPHPAFVPCIAIDPLADEYRKITPALWWDGVTSFAVPAETFIPHIHGDTIICWNCLDHCIGWRDILCNMRYYGNPGARFAIATDFWPNPFDGHPGLPRDEFEHEIAAHFEVIDRREPFGRQLALLLRSRETNEMFCAG